MAADAAAMVVADMQKAGVGILAGCDAMIAGFCLHDELTLMVKGECRPPPRCRQRRSIPRDPRPSRRSMAWTLENAPISFCSMPTRSRTLPTCNGFTP